MSKNSELVVKAFNNLTAKEQDVVLKKLIKSNVTKKAKLAISIPKIGNNLKSFKAGSKKKLPGILDRNTQSIVLGPLDNADIFKTNISLGPLNSAKDRKNLKRKIILGPLDD